MLFIIGKIFIIPIKKILKFVFNSIIGGCLIAFINLIGGIGGFHIGLNIYTSVLVRNFRCTWYYNFDCCKNNFRKLITGKKCTWYKNFPEKKNQELATKAVALDFEVNYLRY